MKEQVKNSLRSQKITVGLYPKQVIRLNNTHTIN